MAGEMAGGMGGGMGGGKGGGIAGGMAGRMAGGVGGGIGGGMGGGIGGEIGGIIGSNFTNFLLHLQKIKTFFRHLIQKLNRYKKIYNWFNKIIQTKGRIEPQQIR